MGVEAGVGVVERAIRSMGALDIDAVLDLLADDVVLELPFRHDGGSPRLVGGEARAFIRAMPKLFRQMVFHDVVVHGTLPSGTIVAEYRSEGITRGGRPYPNRYVAFFVVRDGLIAEWREFFDPTVIAAAFPAAG